MLKIDSKNLNYSASSRFDDVVAANMNASYHGGNEVYVNMNIVNIELYNVNKSAVEADFAEFCATVMEVISKLNGTDIEIVVPSTEA